METSQRKIAARLDDGTDYEISYWQVESGRPGPCVLVTAVLHGTELQGAEIVRRFKPQVEQSLLRGSCLFVPFANPVAVKKRQPHIDFRHGHYYGSDFTDNVNCTWPGNPEGSSAERLSYALFHSVVEQATHLIDLHCWAHIRTATALTRAGRPDCRALVEASGLPFGRHAVWKPEVKERPVTPCTLSSYFNDTGRTGMVVEFSGQYGFWPEQIDLGVRALRNMFRFLDMLPGEIERPERPLIWLNESEEWHVAAPASGVFVPRPLKPGDPVSRGTSMGHIMDLDDLSITEAVSPADGFIFRFGPTHDVGWEQTRMFLHPFVKEGQEIITIVESTTG